MSFPIHNPIVSDSHSYCFRFTILLFPIHNPVVSDSQSCCFRFTILLFPIHNNIVSDWQSCSFRFTILSFKLFSERYWWRCPSVSILILIYLLRLLTTLSSDKGIKGNFVNRTSHSLRWEVTKSTSTVPLQPDILYFS